MNKNLAQKYLNDIKKEKTKHVTTNDLSQTMGFYPDVISRDLSEFEPLLNFDLDYNLKNLVERIEEYIASFSSVNTSKKTPVVKTKGVSYQQFIYNKMTLPGGLFDINNDLSDDDLRILKKLLDDELKKRKI